MLKFSNDEMLIILQYSTHAHSWTHSAAGCVVVVVGALENPAQGLCVDAINEVNLSET